MRTSSLLLGLSESLNHSALGRLTGRTDFAVKDGIQVSDVIYTNRCADVDDAID